MKLLGVKKFNWYARSILFGNCAMPYSQQAFASSNYFNWDNELTTIINTNILLLK